MDNTHIVAVGIRLFCVWLAVWLLVTVPQFFWLMHTSELELPTVSITVGAVIVCAIIIFVLWRFPIIAARGIVPREARSSSRSRLRAAQLQQVGFCLLGLWLLTKAIPRLFALGFVFYWSTRPEMAPVPRMQYAPLISAVVELLLAAWLLFGARGLLGLIDWVRTAGSGPRGTVQSAPQQHEVDDDGANTRR